MTNQLMWLYTFMSIRPLLIDEATRKRIAEVIDFAGHNLYTEAEMLQLVSNQDKDKIPGNVDGYGCFIPTGFRCVFTIEKHPIGWCKHLSISVDTKDKLPAMEATVSIAKEFGLEVESMDDFDDSWLEELCPGLTAVNVIKKVKIKSNATASKNMVDK